MTRLLVVAVLAVGAGCLDRTAAVCGDGSICAPGTVCALELDRCVAPDQVAACEGLAEGAACSSASAAMGACTSGVCIQPACGNGVIEAGELCDDGNTVSGDGCRADCLSGEVCGNGIIDPGEECDCGTAEEVADRCDKPNSQSGSVCRLDCVLHCGDGVVSAGEQCDPGVAAATSCLDLAAGYDRGLTECSATCRPVEETGTCRYLGWRTYLNEFNISVSDIVFTGPRRGFGTSRVSFGGAAAPFADLSVDMDAGWPAGAPLNGVWAETDDFAVVVGDDGTIGAWDGAAWVEQTSGTTQHLYDVWGRSASELYAVGAAGTVLRGDGTSWTPVSFPTSTTLLGVAGDADDMYVVGEGGALYHYDGNAFTDLAPATSETLRGVWAAGGRVVAVGDAGTIVEINGGVPEVIESATRVTLHAVWGHADEGFYAAGERGVVLWHDGTGWRRLSLGAGIEGSDVQPFFSAAGFVGIDTQSGSSDVVHQVGIAGDEGLATFEGAGWSPSSAGTVETLLDVWGAAVDDVFAVGRAGTILHHDGVAWTPQPSGVTVDLNAVYGTATDEVIAVGDAGTALHYDGLSWSVVATGTDHDLYDVWAAGPGDVYAVGRGIMLHYDGADWTTIPFPTTGPIDEPDPPVDPEIELRAVWGRSSNELYVVGPNGGYTKTGQIWVYRSTLVGTDVVGDDTEIYMVNGDALSTLRMGEQARIPGAATVAYSPATGLVVAGADGGLYLWRDDTLEPIRSRSVFDLTSLFVIDDLVFIAGVEGTLDVLVYRQ